MPATVVVTAVAAMVVVGLATGRTFGGLSAAGDGPLPVVAWIAVLLLPGVMWGVWHRVRLGDEPLYRCVLAGLCYPLFLLLGVAATWRGTARHIGGRNSGEDRAARRASRRRRRRGGAEGAHARGRREDLGSPTG